MVSLVAMESSGETTLALQALGRATFWRRRIPISALAISYAEVFKLIEALKNLRECDVLADSQRPGIRGIRFSPNGSFLLVFG